MWNDIDQYHWCLIQFQGSVDENSRSDDEYDDLAMEDSMDDSYLPDNEIDEPTDTKDIASDKIMAPDGMVAVDKYQFNLEHFLSEQLAGSSGEGIKVRRRSMSDPFQLPNRAQSIPLKIL